MKTNIWNKKRVQARHSWFCFDFWLTEETDFFFILWMKSFWCDHSNESYRAVLSCSTVYYAVQGGSNFWVCGWNPKVWPFKWKLLSSTFPWHCLLWPVQCGSNFWVCGWDPIVWPFKWKLLSSILSCGTVYYTVQGGSIFWVCGWNPKVWPFKWKLLSNTFLWCYLLYCTRWFSFWNVWWILEVPLKWKLLLNQYFPWCSSNGELPGAQRRQSLFFTCTGETCDLGSNILTLLSLVTVASCVPSDFQLKLNTCI